MRLAEFTVATAPIDPPDGIMAIIEDGADGARCLAISFDRAWWRIEPEIGEPINSEPPQMAPMENEYAHA